MTHHRLLARKTQQSTDNTYQAHGCSPYIFLEYATVPCKFSGDVQDPIVDIVSCDAFRLKPVQNICLAPDPTECSIGKSSKGEDPLESVHWDEKVPNIVCSFNLDRIDTVDQLRNFAKKFPETLKDTLLTSFCGTPIHSNCAQGLENGCSRFLTTDDIGIYCRGWLSGLSHDHQDAVMRNYCLSNNTDDCKCINRTFDPDYDQLKNLGNYFSDNCWYKPCANTASRYLVPNKLSEQHCASNVCQQIIDVHTKGQVDISGNLNNINCNFDGHTIPKSREKSDEPVKPADREKREEKRVHPVDPEVSTGDELGKWLKKNWIIVLIVVIGILIFVI